MRVNRPWTATALAVAVLPTHALAHEGHALTASTAAVAVPLLLAGGVFAAGLVRGRRHLGRAAFFFAGCSLLAAALIGRLEEASHASLAAHMIQHMILIVVAPPLLLLARPLPIMLRGLPRALSRRLAAPLAKLYAISARHALSAFVLHGAVIWLWHVPALFQAAQSDPVLHYFEHATFLGTALWFWWTLVAPARSAQGGLMAASLWAGLTVMHTGMLGALLTFAPALFYPDHPTGLWGLPPLEDQQLAASYGRSWVMGRSGGAVC